MNENSISGSLARFEDGNDFIFNEDEVLISDTIVGTGSFGEVRLAKWRGINVAAKKLHDLAFEDEDGMINQLIINEDSMKREMNVLCKLRHPNLVLFLGVCQNSESNRITTILTELLPISLYQILEESSKDNTKLNLIEIINISIDISAGLDYLHSHNPPVIHRDISAKNVLIKGNTAKIADLGQAKIFDSSINNDNNNNNNNNNNLVLPGSMAYSAPEVLSGQYSEKIDIFSFGILLMQMCTNEYPRIDKREEQLIQAKTNFPIFNILLDLCLSHQPDTRITSHVIYEKLDAIKQNDRYYPSINKNGPQQQAGILSLRWMNNEIQRRCRDSSTALEQTSRRLTAESERLRTEIKRNDELEKSIKEFKENISELERRLNMQDRTNEELEDELAAIGTAKERAESKIKELESDNLSLETSLDEASEVITSKSSKLKELTSKLEFSKSENIKWKTKIQELMSKEEELKSSLSTSHRMLGLKDEECEETLTRLEQALTRWESEKKLRESESDRCKRLTKKGGEMQQQMLTLEKELESIEVRMHQYDELPLPDEIKQRFTDLENEIEITLKSKLEREEELALSNERLQDLDNVKNELQVELDGCKRLLHDRDMEILNLKEIQQEHSQQVSIFEEKIDNLATEIESRDMTIIELQGDKGGLEDVIEEIKMERDSYSKTVKILKEKIKDLEDSIKNNIENQGGIKSKPEEEEEEEDPLKPVSGEEGGTLESFRASPMRGMNSRGTIIAGSSMDVFKKGITRPDLAPTTKNNKSNDNNDEERKESSNKEEDEINKYMNETDEEKHKADKTAKLMVSHSLDRGGHLELTKTLTENYSNYHVVWRASRSLRDIIIKDDEAKSQCLMKGLDEVLIASMKNNMFSSIAQSQCLRLIGALSYGNDHVRRRVGERGGISLALDAMRSHVTDETLQLHACTAITNLTHNSIDNRYRFVESGGVEILVSIMNNFIKNMKLQRQACWAILTLAANDDVCLSIVANGGGTALVSAMMEHRFDAGVQQFGAWALGNLAAASDDVRRRLKINGALEACRICMETYPDDLEVIRQARTAITAMGLRDEKK